jgi:two-component system, NtrC family, response regulator AtoC
LKGSVLIIDDEATFREALARLLERDGYDVEAAGTVADGLAAWSRARPDVVLLDYLLPDGTGLEVLARIRETEKDVPVVMMTAFGSVETAVSAMRAGATDYVAKGADVVAEIRMKVEQARKVSTLSDEVDYRRRHGTEEPEPLTLLKASRALETVVQRIREVARSPETTVLVRGETGTGKELVARAVHEAGLGAGSPLIEVDCASIPENLLESELFGHEKGAFSGADRQKRGLLELAAGGTVLLDEIGEMPERLQSKMLRVLEERHFRRVGGTRNLDLSARVIAMTNRDLAKIAREGKFREDLYYRLSVFEIVLPPLRERLDDALTVAEHFVGRFNRKLGKRVPGLSPEARAFLKTYDYPGNVRELRNMIERAMVRAPAEEPLSQELITGLQPPRIDSHAGRPAPMSAPASPAATPGAFTFILGKDHLPDIEKTLLNEALSAAGGNKTQAAALLGISRFQLLRKLGREEAGEISETLPLPPKTS